LPAGSLTAKNSWGKMQYNGPCPPQGKLHHYVFRLYALDTVLKLDSDADALALLTAMQNHVLGVAELKAVFAK
jgi:Raf kinase inhibitor-like YbhB/YbcL family protein